MSVRVNKSAFNIREKLSELERPIGLKGSELMRAETAQDARDLVSAGRKNLVINGDMRIAQRGTSQASVNSSGYYAVDRFHSTLNSLGVWTVSRESDAPDGFQYSLKHTCTTADASPATGDYAIVYHRFEKQNIEHLNYGSSAAQDVTLSFWVKSNKTGSASVGVFFYGSGDNRFINRTYTINASDTWEHKTVTFKGNTEFPFSSSNTDTGLTIEWWMNSGSNYQGNTENIWTIGEGRNISNLGVGGATSDYFSLTGVQLEVGKNATEFEHRSYGEELALCERYFQLLTTGSDELIGTGYVVTASNVNTNTYLRTHMRSAPTLYSNNSGAAMYRCNSSSADSNTNSQPTINQTISSTFAIFLSWTGFSGLTGGQACQVRQYLATGVLAVQSEL